MKNKIRAYVKSYPISAFIFFTFLFSWSIWGVLYSSSISIINNIIYKKYLSVLVCIGAYGPSTMSVVLTGCLYSKKGLKELLIRLTKWKYSPIYYLITIFYFTVSIFISYSIFKHFGGKIEINLVTNPYNIAANFAVILFLGGPFNEEIGWRGFLLPRLQKRFHPFVSSLILGGIWSFWHLPLFFIPGTSQYGVSFYLFIISTTWIAIFMTWVFNRTDGSLVFPILFHTGANMSAVLMGTASFKLNNFCMLFAVQIIVVIFVAGNMILDNRKPYISL